MTGNLYVTVDKFNKIVEYFFKKDISFSNQIINLKDGRKIKAQPYPDKKGVEIMCSDSEIKKMLENIIEEND